MEEKIYTVRTRTITWITGILLVFGMIAATVFGIVSLKHANTQYGSTEGLNSKINTLNNEINIRNNKINILNSEIIKLKGEKKIYEINNIRYIAQLEQFERLMGFTKEQKFRNARGGSSQLPDVYWKPELGK